MKTFPEEIFRIKGQPVAKIFKSRLTEIKYISLANKIVLDKNELILLIDWLIKKHDEM